MHDGQSGRTLPGTPQVPLTVAFSRLDRHRRRTGRVQDAWLRSLTAAQRPSRRQPPPSPRS
jgi:hypothetical protein